MNSDQVFLSMMLNKVAWYNTEFIAIDKKGKNDSIRKILGVPEGQRYMKGIDFFDEKGRYKLEPFIREATATNIPNKFQRDFKDVHMRLSVLDQALQEYRGGQYPVQDSLYGNFIKNAIPYYLITLQKAIKTGDYADADKLLRAFKQNQVNNGNEVLPSERKINIEFFAHQNWVDPAVGNLVPVLDSYWLMIHTSVIVGSYGPLTLNIAELTIINEIVLTVGLVMLTIGNFLGGQWANESWGRYWGWDPKETWALISIMVYAFVIHTRLVPGLRGLNTICTHTGEVQDEQFKGAISPLYMSTSYAFEDVDVKRYPRYFNTPNQEALCKKVAALEHTEAGLIFGSGMAAITDLAAVASIAKQHNLVSMIDNTFASPVNQNPADFGIDIIIHSATKYMGGHSDICAGAVAFNRRKHRAYFSFGEKSRGSLSDQTSGQGIKDGLIRFSVGIEESEDLIADIEQAIQKVKSQTVVERTLNY
ncbi:Protein NrfI [Nymphon striatum]|nr:Protein NrfI [Nymphon striatum]